ncbi:hypothetical protein J4421_03115 [Candidatus Woesearchaeota archaeon]|nr:hypothetical protein [Candidatus Woesearchaeota archaeon]
MLLTKNKEYLDFLQKIKVKIRSAQIKAALSVNRELINLYWDLSKMIGGKQANSKWGDSVIEALSSDLKREFPNMKGFSRANLFNIRQWHHFYSKMDEKVQQLVRQLPWGHNVV